MTIQQVLQQASRDLKARRIPFHTVRLESTADVSSQGTLRSWAYLYVERPESDGIRHSSRRSLVSSGNADECYDGFQKWLDAESLVRQTATV